MDKRRMCPHCRAFITNGDKVCPYCDTVVGPRAVERRSPADLMGGLIPHARFTTMMILLINTGLYIATILYSSKILGQTVTEPDYQALIDFGGKSGRQILLYGQWWRLITAGFLHGGTWHILMNSWVLFDLGVQVEQAFGTARYLVIYFVSTITGFLASLYWAPVVLSIGASAGIFGLIGAMIALGVRDRSAYGAALRSVYGRWALYGLAFGILPSLIGISFMDNAAHLGGLAGGFALGYVAGAPGSSRAAEGFWRAAAGISLALTAIAFAQMFLGLLSQTR